MKNAEQPAFPRAGSEHTNLADHITHEPTEGLTKREYFAAMVIQGKSGDPKEIAEHALWVADELLKLLEK